jgi:hypothetical protein
MSKSTPGPWRTSDSGEWTANHDGFGSSCYQGIKDELGNVVALAVAHDPKHFSDPDTQANACLIAAAPDLLEALQEVVKLANQAHDHWDNDRDAKVGKILLALSGHMPRYDKRIDAIHAAIAKATGETK